MIGPPNALVRSVTTSDSHDGLVVTVSDGPRHGTVCWDRVRCTYRAEIDVFAPMPGVDGRTDHRAPTADSVWAWLADPEPAVLPERVAVGHRPVELLTIDSVVNRLATFGFRPDRASLGALFGLRSAVRDRCGSVVVQGRLHRSARGTPTPRPVAELHLGLPDGEPLPLRPLLEHPDHGFGWGHRGAAAMRTASVLVDLAWSSQRDAATEAAVVDLAVTVLAEVRDGFVWQVESVADWIATESGDLSTGARGMVSGAEASGPTGFRQLSFEFR